MTMRSYLLPSMRNRLTFFVCAILLMFSTGCSTSASEKTLLAQKTFEESQNPGYSKEEKTKKIREAIHIAPKEPMYRVAMGNVYFKNLELDKAERMYLSAIKVDPEYRGSYRQLGRLYVQKSQWDDAIFYLNQALSFTNVIDPIQLYNWLAYSHYRKGDLPKAEKAWLKALDIHDSGQIRLNLALAYKEAEHLNLARTSLLRALELNPKLLGAHFALGEIYYRDNKFAQAKKHLAEVIQLEPLSEQAKVSKELINRMSAQK